MCCGCSGPPFGLPIPPEIHEQYSDDVKEAWLKFDAWWKDAKEKADGDLVDRKSMPEDVRAAMQLILDTPIPVYEGATGADSCYMIAILMQMTNPE